MQRSDEGSYRVQASNRAGQGDGNFSVVVICECMYRLTMATPMYVAIHIE